MKFIFEKLWAVVEETENAFHTFDDVVALYTDRDEAVSQVEENQRVVTLYLTFSDLKGYGLQEVSVGEDEDISSIYNEDEENEGQEEEDSEEDTPFLSGKLDKTLN